MDTENRSLCRSPISIVIASKGDRSALCETVNKLVDILRPKDQVVIVIPKTFQTTFNSLVAPNLVESEFVTVFFANTLGQVRQRLYGLERAINDLVMQLDDDVQFTEGSLDILLDCWRRCVVTRGDNVVIAPIQIQRSARLDASRPRRRHVPHLISENEHICSIRCDGLGSYSLQKLLNNEHLLVRTEWLPGGCVVGLRKNFPIRNYYPFDGYAYGEDMLDSVRRSNKEIPMFICPSARILVKDRSLQVPMSLYDCRKQIVIQKLVLKHHGRLGLFNRLLILLRTALKFCIRNAFYVLR